MAGQRCPVGPGALHASSPQHSERRCPGHQLLIASRGGRKARAAQPGTQGGQHRSNVLIAVGVYADHDLFSCTVVVLVVCNAVGHAGHGHLSPDRHGTDGRRRAGVGGQNCDGALLTARPLSGHAHPVRRQQAPPQARADRSAPRQLASCIAGQTTAWDGTPAIFTIRPSFGAEHADPHSCVGGWRARAGWQDASPLGRVPPPRSGFAWFRFPPDVIMLAVRWYLRYGLSYRDVEELRTERGVTVDHVTVYRWV